MIKMICPLSILVYKNLKDIRSKYVTKSAKLRQFCKEEAIE